MGIKRKVRHQAAQPPLVITSKLCRITTRSTATRNSGVKHRFRSRVNVNSILFGDFRHMDWIYWVRLTHTLIFIFASACIAYVVYCGIVGKTDNYLWAALGIVFMIGLIYAVNGFECPLATVVHRLAGRRDIPDIFFPDWFANKIMPVSTGVYVVGLALVARRQYRKRKSKRSPSMRDPHD